MVSGSQMLESEEASLSSCPPLRLSARFPVKVWVGFLYGSACRQSVLKVQGLRRLLGQGVFFLLWPLFARAPRHWFLVIFLLSAPGVQSVFFRCAPLGAAPFRRGQSKKKKHHPGCFFFAPAPGKSRGRRSPVGRRHGARAKKNTTQGGLFFGSGPGERHGKEKPCWAPARGQSKKKTPGWCFFLLWPRAGANRVSPSPAFPRGRSKKKTPWVVFFFALAPCRRPTGLLLPLPFAGAAAKKKKNTLGGVFLCSDPVPAPNGLLLPLPFAGAGAKKENTLGGVFFFAAAPRGR